MAITDVGLVRGPQGPVGLKGDKGDPFTYADFTESQIAELQRPATEAATRANKATEDAQAAISEVKATEAKLYPVAENTLKGKTKDTFIHVDDAFPSTLLGIEIEGVCRQDGTPSPDNPVPIEVVENPILWVTGRNLLDIHEGMSENDCSKAFENNTKRIIKPGTYVIGLTANNYCNNNNIKNVQIGNGAVSFTSTAPGYGIGFGVSLVPGVTYKFGAQGNAELRFAFYSADGTWLSNVTTSTPTVPINAVYSVLVMTSLTEMSDVAMRDIYGAATQITYEPYAGTSHVFNLPAEHPYLAKLPNGTADEIVIDAEGNVELVARVGKTDNTTPFTNLYEEKANRADFQVSMKIDAVYGINTSMSPFCRPGDVNAIEPVMGGVVKGNYVRMTRPEKVTNLESAKAYLKELNFVMWFSCTEKTYQLGKIEMPKAQDNVTNVWTDAEVTPRTGIEYTRDVNIVVANLESAIASITQG